MPRKPRGILARFANWLGKTFDVLTPDSEPGPESQPEPPPPPPRRPPGRGVERDQVRLPRSRPLTWTTAKRYLPDDASHEARMQLIYRMITGNTTEYLDWRELYNPVAVVFEGDDRQEERYWDMFLRSFYLTTQEPGHIVRGSAKHPGRFYRDTGIPPSEVDWELWRDMRRGTT